MVALALSKHRDFDSVDVPAGIHANAGFGMQDADPYRLKVTSFKVHPPDSLEATVPLLIQLPQVDVPASHTAICTRPESPTS